MGGARPQEWLTSIEAHEAAGRTFRECVTTGEHGEQAVLDTERWAGYEAAWPGHHRQPFEDGVQYPRVITRKDAGYAAWAPDDSVTSVAARVAAAAARYAIR